MLVLLPLELVRLGLVGPLLQAQLRLELLALVEQQLVQRLGQHQALRLLALELLGLVGPLLRAQLHLEQLVLVRQELEQLPAQHQGLQ